MKFTREQYDEIVLTLENEGNFHRRYTRPLTLVGERRNLIKSWLGPAYNSWGRARDHIKLSFETKHNDIEDREQIRRYLDDRYDIACDCQKYDYMPSIWNGALKEKAIEDWKQKLIDARAAGETLQIYERSRWIDEEQYTETGFLFRGAPSMYRIKPKPADPYSAPATVAESVILPPVFPSLKKTTMYKTAITITAKTLINGQDINDFTDADIYSMIAAQEAEIEALSKIKAQPKKLVAEIAKRQAGIDALVAHLDAAV